MFIDFVGLWIKLDQMSRIATLNALFAVFSQWIIFPYLALSIKKRFRNIDVKMDSSVFWSNFNISNFWNEAETLNRWF